MAKAKKKSTHSAGSPQRSSGQAGQGLMREIPVLHSLVTVLYILLGILFIAIYLTRFV